MQVFLHPQGRRKKLMFNDGRIYTGKGFEIPNHVHVVIIACIICYLCPVKVWTGFMQSVRF